ncbi:Ankyrin-1 [Hondaea fermentalgiana]|uniref:Ankyrin-1 n=1 Tax=Hondaea fermentalgiana TaxID=2315210 RepID=A0A2R5G5N6_9STRA|nr:Ankyrin-1 [Hondaea fermentalgiana]|eukprot:GBG25855.1 Ankyrin-1 [Hondaea fermentalgiana]
MQQQQRRASGSKAARRSSSGTSSSSSLALAQAVFSKAAEGKRLAEARKRQQRKEIIAANAFNFAELPFDIQEMVLRYLPANEIGMACAVCKSWNHIYQGAVASIFAQVVGVARGRSRLMRRAELQLVHRLRNTHEKETAIETALWAAFNGYNDYVIRLLTDKRGAINVNTSGSEEWDLATALHVACRQGNAKLVRALLDLDANPACLTKSRQTPLLLACEYGYPAIVDLLLKKCGRALSVNTQDSAGRTALFVACDKGFVEVVVKLVDWGEMIQQETGEELAILDLNLGTLERGSPLCTACRTGQSKIVRRLLDAQAHVNCTTEDGRTAFFCAVERGALNTTKLLLEKRPPLTMQKMANLLFQARPRDGREAAQALAETETEVPNVHPGRAGVLIDFASNTGKTPVFVAAERGNTALLRVLMDGHANTNKPTFLNKTPLYAATENGHTEVVKLLLAACTRENVLHQTNFGTTAPFMAQRNGHMAIKRLLDEFCADKLTTEKARNRKSKKKQKSAMDRLLSKKDKNPHPPQQPAALASMALEQERISCMSDTAEGKDRDIAKSKATIDTLVSDIDALQAAVTLAFSRQQQGLSRDDPLNASNSDEADLTQNAGSTSPEAQVPVPAPAPASPAPLLHEEEAATAVAESTTMSISESAKEQDTIPADLEDASVDHKPESEITPKVAEEKVLNEQRERGSPRDDEPMPDGGGPVNPVNARQARAAFFEKKFGKPTRSPRQQGGEEALASPNQEGEARHVPKKERDLLAARKWSKSFIPVAAEDTEASRSSAEETAPVTLQGAALELAAFDLKGTSFEADSVDRLQFISWAQASPLGKEIFEQVLSTKGNEA